MLKVIVSLYLVDTSATDSPDVAVRDPIYFLNYIFVAPHVGPKNDDATFQSFCIYQGK